LGIPPMMVRPRHLEPLTTTAVDFTFMLAITEVDLQ
jgi:hypothetical protein